MGQTTELKAMQEKAKQMKNKMQDEQIQRKIDELVQSASNRLSGRSYDPKDDSLTNCGAAFHHSPRTGSTEGTTSVKSDLNIVKNVK